MRDKNRNFESDTYICRTLTMYFWLTKHGFEPRAVETDRKNYGRIVWLYENSPELRVSLKEYYTKTLKRRNRNKHNPDLHKTDGTLHPKQGYQARRHSTRRE